MENIINTILEYIKYILKFLIYFDTRIIQIGGAQDPPVPPPGAGAAAPPAPPGAAGAAAAAKPGAAGAAAAAAGKKPDAGKDKDKGKKDKDAKKDNKGGEEGGEKEESEDSEKDGEDEDQILWIFTWLKDIFMSILGWFGTKAASIASTLLFASTAPILPFFLVMAGMYGTVKYFLYKIRRL